MTALSKLAFCFRITADTPSFFRLLINTKRYSTTKHAAPDAFTEYHIQFRGIDSTIYLRTYGGDLQIFYDVFWRNIYQLPGDIFRKASVIVDLGAHTGMSSLYFQYNAPDARIISLEPDADNYGLLQRNVKTTAVHAAISNDNIAYLQKSEKSYNSFIGDEISARPVRAITMDTLLLEQGIDRIDILKVDIEGAEKYLFAGDTNWLSSTNHILIELHTAELVEEFRSLAEKYQFKVAKREMVHENIYYACKR